MLLAPWFLLYLLTAQNAALPGCKWAPWSDQDLGVAMMVQQCEGAAAREFKTDGLTVRMVRPGQQAARGVIVLEVFEKPERQKIQEAIALKYIKHLTPRQQAGCEVVSYDDRYSLGDRNKQNFTVVPNALFRAEAARMNDPDPCGDHAVANAIGYFEYHPGEYKGRFIFVRHTPEPMMFDPRSIRILAP
ncbi:MAG: hypothetical protein HY858_08080 [Candidatus Solibacter usitatus]|nr:hypothetical protein [Candidatus Solibacter usitatus]